jgi:hypothetical protein
MLFLVFIFMIYYIGQSGPWYNKFMLLIPFLGLRHKMVKIIISWQR